MVQPFVTRGHGNRRQVATAVPRPPPADPAPRAPALGGHVIRLSGSRAFCNACRQSSPQLAKFAAMRCPGSTALRWARVAASHARLGVRLGSGHRRAISGSVVWRIVCGAYAEHAVCKLSQPCAGRACGTAKARLDALRAGFHPRSGAALPPAVFEFQESDLGGERCPRVPHQRQGAKASPGDASARLAALRQRVRARAADAAGLA